MHLVNTSENPSLKYLLFVNQLFFYKLLTLVKSVWLFLKDASRNYFISFSPPLISNAFHLKCYLFSYDLLNYQLVGYSFAYAPAYAPAYLSAQKGNKASEILPD